jgi:hypothetical protein
MAAMVSSPRGWKEHFFETNGSECLKLQNVSGFLG